MDLAIGVALGSSIQIALFVIPVVVLVGWIAGKTFLLNFDAFTVLILTGDTFCSDPPPPPPVARCWGLPGRQPACSPLRRARAPARS